MQRYRIISHGRVLQSSKYTFFAIIFDREKGTYFREEVQDCSTFDEFLQVLKNKLRAEVEVKRR